MPATAQHTQKRAPWTDCITILVSHDPRQLMQMSEVVNGPCREQLRKRDHPQRRMQSASRQVFRLQSQGLQCRQTLVAHSSEFIQKLVQRLALTLLNLRKAIKRIKGSRLALFQDHPGPRYPVGALAEDQVANNVERAPAVLSFVA